MTNVKLRIHIIYIVQGCVETYAVSHDILNAKRYRNIRVWENSRKKIIRYQRDCEPDEAVGRLTVSFL